MAALLLLERRDFFRRAGDVFWWYALLYAAERTVVEGLRTDSLYWGSMRVSQALSLCVLAGVCVLFALRARKCVPLVRGLGAVTALALALLLLLGVLPATLLNCLWVCAVLVALAAVLYCRQAVDPKSA